MDAGRHGRCGEGGRLRSGHLRCGPQRLRVLRQLASPAERQSAGGRGTPSRQAHGHPRHRQGDVQDSVIVQKYGGTSVGNAARIRRVSRRIANTVKRGEQVVAVVSAMGHTTDRLITLAKSVNPEPPARELDMLVANGETITAPLVAMCLQGMGVPAVSLSGLQAGVRTSAHHSRARIHDIKPDRILELLRQGKVPVVAGFQGGTPDTDISTMWRQGRTTRQAESAPSLTYDPIKIIINAND